MLKPCFPLCVAALLVTACASDPGGGDASPPNEPPRTADPEPAGGGPAQEQPASEGSMPPAPAPSAKATPPGGAKLSAVELDIWNSPSFKRQFADSYIAETEIEPTVTADEREAMFEIYDLISADKMDDAARLIEKNRDAAASAVFDYTLGNIHFQRDRLDQAADAYRIAVDKYPKFRRAWGNLANVHVRRGDFENAITGLTRVIELGGGTAIDYGVLGIAHSRMENDVAAETAFRMASLLDPATVEWEMGLAHSLSSQGRFATAAALFGTLIERFPERADLWLAQGEAYARLDLPLKAAENFEMVDRLGESTARSLNNLGNIYANEGLYELAVEAYLRALEKDPGGKPERAIRAAKFLSYNGAHDATAKLIEGIESIQGGDLEVEHQKDLLKLRARLAVAGGSGEEEVRVLKEVVRLDPTDGDALILLGQHSARTGDPEKAILYYERAANIPDFEADAKLRHAEALVKQGRFAEALPLLRRAQTIKPRDHVQDFLEQLEERVKQGR